LRPVFHLIPSLEIGGIETMMTRFIERCPADIRYTLVIFDPSSRRGIHITDAMRQRVLPLGGAGPARRVAHLLRFIMANRGAVIISSTWKMAAMVLLARLIGWRGRHWSFTHRSSSAGPLDYILRRWQVRHSEICLADSAAAAAWIRHQGSTARLEVLRPLFPPPPIGRRKDGGMPIRICFVGRLAPVKNLSCVFELVEALASEGVATAFDIYGPDGGQLSMVQSWLSRTGPPGLYRQYLGVVPPDRTWEVVQNYHFLISCSHTEGFALSVAEAMQVGVVPIVGNVGGPATYCDDTNAVLIDDYSPEGRARAVHKIKEVVDDHARYKRMSAAARSTFHAKSEFVERLSALIREALVDAGDPVKAVAG